MHSSDKLKPLTRHPIASMRELWVISFPLILSAMSYCFMLFTDRIILARYSIDAMNAAAAAFMFTSMFHVTGSSVTAIAEVFVGQYNGAGKKDQLGKPVWQMLWFALLCSVIYIPAALWAGPFLLAEPFHEHGLPYFYWLLILGSLLPLGAPFASFFIGQGKTRIILLATIAGNGMNVVLDWILILGVDGWLEPMGTEGAAIATMISQSIYIVIMAIPFFSAYNRKHHGTLKMRFEWHLFKDCVRIGLPRSVGHLAEVGAWGVMFNILASISEAHVTVLSLGQSVFFLIAFLTDGMQQGVIAVSSNLLGAGAIKLVPKGLKSALKLASILAILSAIPLLAYKAQAVEFMLGGAAAQDILPILYFNIIFVWVFASCDLFTWSTAGVLISAGDTKFVMCMNAISAWVFAIIPTYLLMVVWGASAKWVWASMASYGLTNCTCFYLRFAQGKWKTMQLESE